MTTPDNPRTLMDSSVERLLVAIATWLAAAFFLVLAAWWASTGETYYLQRSMTPAIVATAGAAMLTLERPRAVPLLVLAAGGLFATMAVAPSAQSYAIHGLIALAITTTVLTERNLAAHVGVTTVIVGAAAFMWRAPETPTIERVFGAMVSVTSYSVVAWLVWWLKDRSAAGHRELEELVDTKSEFVATVSHELRTPLTSIVGLAHELHERFDDFTRTEIDEFIRLILAEGTDVANIVEDLLVAARAEIGTLALQVGRLDLRHELALATTDFDPIPIQGIEREDVIRIHADGLRFRQIIRNLLVNAQRYGGQRVRIVVDHTPHDAYIEVRDNGAAISLADREAIFQPYERSQRPGRPGSVGLGLTVSRSLARLMGGDLTYAHDGRESIFALRLPIAAPAYETPQHALESAAAPPPPVRVSRSAP